MRKLLVTLLTLSLLGGLLLTGAMPAQAAVAGLVKPVMHVMTASGATPCDHAKGKQLPAHGEHKGGDLKRCVTGQCPMLGQGVVPSIVAFAASYPSEQPVPLSQAAEAGIPVGPDLRPPRHLI